MKVDTFFMTVKVLTEANMSIDVSVCVSDLNCVLETGLFTLKTKTVNFPLSVTSL